MGATLCVGARVRLGARTYAAIGGDKKVRGLKSLHYVARFTGTGRLHPCAADNTVILLLLLFLCLFSGRRSPPVRAQSASVRLA